MSGVVGGARHLDETRSVSVPDLTAERAGPGYAVPGLDSALDWAAALAEEGGMTLQITHIIENAPQPMLPHESYGSTPPALSGGPHREARAVLDRASARVQERRPDLAVTPTFQLGGPAAVLIEQSKTAHLLVVVVPRGYEARPWPRSWSGWTAVHPAPRPSRSPCPSPRPPERP